MAEFFNMGGYAAYVWSSYGIVTLVLFVNAYQAIKKHKKVQHESKT